MCNLGEAIERQGITKSIARGRAEGIAERAISDLKNLMETMGLSLKQAMAALKIPKAEQQVYVRLLKQ